VDDMGNKTAHMARRAQGLHPNSRADGLERRATDDSDSVGMEEHVRRKINVRCSENQP
jgi:hypothetical protein